MTRPADPAPAGSLRQAGHLCALLLVLAVPAQAQFEISAHVGIHAARHSRSQRVLDRMWSAPGEATTLGLQVSNALTPWLAVEGGALFSRNHSWGGNTSLPAPGFSNNTLFTSARVMARPFEIGRLQLSVGAGPAVMFHYGSGESLLTRSADVGAVTAGLMRLSLGDRWSARVEVQTYLFQSSFSGADGLPARSEFRAEPVILAGVAFRVR